MNDVNRTSAATPDVDLESMSTQEANEFVSRRLWTEEEYFELENQRRMEYSQGAIEVLPVATETHQDITIFCFDALRAFTRAHAPGKVSFSGIRIRVREGEFREPDVAYMKAENAHRRHDKFWEGADLLMETVSPDPKDRVRDLEQKPRDYAEAHIPEYWIIDPQEQKILVLTLEGDTYRVHGEYTKGMRATSVLLPGFAVSVDEVFAQKASA